MQKVCRVCGKKFRPRRATTQYCSRACYTRFRRQGMTYCETCGKPFHARGRETVCPACVSEIPPYQPPDTRIMPPLSSLSGAELFSYGKLSAMRQLRYLEAERERASAIALRNKRRERSYE